MKALGLLGEKELAIAASALAPEQTCKTAGAVVDRMIAFGNPRHPSDFAWAELLALAEGRMPLGESVWIGIDYAAPDAKGGKP